jgi:sec-independent protein translocase protein TatA
MKTVLKNYFSTETNVFSFFLLLLLSNIWNMISNLIFLAIGPGQIVVIAVIILLLFGGRKIPELMRGLGSGIKEFKEATKEDEAPKKDSEK